MQRIGFYLIYFPLFLLSLLPLPLLYVLSDFLFFIVFHLTGYRKKVVTNNMHNSFPLKSEKEIEILVKKFYRHFCDLIVESIKLLSITQKETIKRCIIPDHSLHLLNQLHAQGKSLILVLGHYGNWELGGLSFSAQINHCSQFIYKPLSNEQFDTMMIRVRTRFGARVLAMQNALREMLKNRNEITATAFIADQTPAPESAYWTQFLNQDTPVFWGTEKIARKLNYPVVFINVKKKKRGFYELTAEMLVENPSSTKDGEITEIHTRRLEKEITQQPEYWLWSHRRWKHRRSCKL